MTTIVQASPTYSPSGGSKSGAYKHEGCENRSCRLCATTQSTKKSIHSDDIIDKYSPSFVRRNTPTIASPDVRDAQSKRMSASKRVNRFSLPDSDDEDLEEIIPDQHGSFFIQDDSLSLDGNNTPRGLRISGHQESPKKSPSVKADDADTLHSAYEARRVRSVQSNVNQKMTSLIEAFNAIQLQKEREMKVLSDNAQREAQEREMKLKQAQDKYKQETEARLQHVEKFSNQQALVGEKRLEQYRKMKQDEENARKQKEDEERRKREEEERKRREEEDRRRREQEEAERQRREEEERRRREEEDRQRREREEAERRRQEEEAQRAAAAQTPAAAAPSQPTGGSAATQAGATAPITQGAAADQASPQAKLEYNQKLENLKRVADLIVPMETHPRKRDMFRIVNTGVNQISASRAQVLQKITDFTRILTESKADDMVHNYTLNLFAQKFLEQADIVVSRKPESAFAVAMVAVNVAKSHPALMELFIGQLYTACPYAVPYYLPRPQGMSDQDYAITVLKYKKKSNNPEGRETQEEYYERMSGIIYLYSAMMVTPVTDGKHPYGIEHAWKWLARILNLKPRRITPVLLLAFLEHTAYFLAAKYGRQFSKLLLFIRDDYLQRLPANTTAAKTRLELFLGDWQQNGGRFSEPNGYRYE